MRIILESYLLEFKVWSVAVHRDVGFGRGTLPRHLQVHRRSRRLFPEHFIDFLRRN